MPKKRKKKRKNHYFTKDHEKVIIQYANCEDYEERNRMYNETLAPVFNELVNKIVFTYKFNSLPNIDILKEDCKVWLTTVVGKFDPSKGHAAFSYFSVITKNWFIQEIKKRNKKSKREILLEDAYIEENVAEQMIVYNEYDQWRETAEFWQYLWGEIEVWDNENLKENEKKVLEAVKILLSSSEEIEIFNKKAIYLYLREITGLNTKQVVNNLNRLRVRYREFKKKWEAGKI